MSNMLILITQAPNDSITAPMPNMEGIYAWQTFPGQGSCFDDFPHPLGHLKPVFLFLRRAMVHALNAPDSNKVSSANFLAQNEDMQLAQVDKQDTLMEHRHKLIDATRIAR